MFNVFSSKPICLRSQNCIFKLHLFRSNVGDVKTMPFMSYISEVSSRVHLSALLFKSTNTMHFTRFSQISLYVALRRWRNRINCIVLYGFKKQVKTRRKLAHWGSWDTVCILNSILILSVNKSKVKIFNFVSPSSPLPQLLKVVYDIAPPPQQDTGPCVKFL